MCYIIKKNYGLKGDGVIKFFFSGSKGNSFIVKLIFGWFN